MEGRDGGDGKTSPFGNHAGAPASGSKSGGHDFLKSPSLPSGGPTHDFTKAGTMAASGESRDMTKGDAPAQKDGDGTETGLDNASVPSGGRIPHVDARPGAPDVQTTRKPWGNLK